MTDDEKRKAALRTKAYYADPVLGEERRAKRREYNRAYAVKRADAIREYNRAYHAAHREAINAERLRRHRESRKKMSDEELKEYRARRAAEATVRRRAKGIGPRKARQPQGYYKAKQAEWYTNRTERQRARHNAKTMFATRTGLGRGCIPDDLLESETLRLMIVSVVRKNGARKRTGKRT